jgi:maltooligosyltrehalose trehalohydrolase
VLDWDARHSPEGRRRLALVQDLLAIRQREIVPRLAGAAFGDAGATDDGLLTARWRLGDGAALRLTANLSAGEIAGERGDSTGTSIWGNQTNGSLPPWSVFWRVGEP